VAFYISDTERRWDFQNPFTRSYTVRVVDRSVQRYGAPAEADLPEEAARVIQAAVLHFRRHIPTVRHDCEWCHRPYIAAFARDPSAVRDPNLDTATRVNAWNTCTIRTIRHCQCPYRIQGDDPNCIHDKTRAISFRDPGTGTSYVICYVYIGPPYRPLLRPELYEPEATSQDATTDSDLSSTASSKTQDTDSSEDSA